MASCPATPVPNILEIKKRFKLYGNEFGNDFYKIKFDSAPNDEELGAKYVFSLKDAVDDCPEYLINPIVLEKHALKHRLKIHKIVPFPSFYLEFKDRFKSLLQRMRAIPAKGLTDLDRSVIELYSVLIMKKY